MLVYETPDFEMILSLLPYLPELSEGSLLPAPQSTRTLFLSQGLSSKFGLSWKVEKTSSGRLAARIGVPDIASATNYGQTIFDILLKLRLVKAYLVKGEAALFLAIKPALSEDAENAFYALRLPISLHKTRELMRANSIVLTRMGGAPAANERQSSNEIHVNLMYKNQRPWEQLS